MHELIFVAQLIADCKNYTIYGKRNSNEAGGLFAVVQ